MSFQFSVRTPLGHRVESVLGYPSTNHPSRPRLVEVLVELTDGTFKREYLPISALSIEVA